MSSLRTHLDFYAAKFRAELALQFAYRAAVAIWMLGLLIDPVVYLVVWTTVARALGGAAGGFSTGDLAAYFAIVMVVNQLTFSWHFGVMEWRVRNGFFSPVLLRPIHPIHNDLTENLTYKLLTLTVILPTAVLLLYAFDASVQTTLVHAVAFVPALLLAMVLRFVVEWTLGLAALWITRTDALNQAYIVVFLFLSGRIAPLDLLPAPVQSAAALLPFRWMLSFPVETLQGRLPPAEIVAGLGVQVVWVVIALAVLRVVWAAGLRRYSAVGA